MAQFPEKAGIEQHGGLDDLGAAAAVFPLRQCRQQRRVAQHHGGLMKAAGLIFAVVKVHGGLAAHGGVHHGQQRGRYLNIGDAPLVGGGGEARKVPHHAAAQRDDDILTGEAAVTEKIQCAAVGCKGLMLFPVGKNEVLRLKTGVLQGLLSLLAVKGKHGVIGDERRPASGELPGGQCP